MTNLAAPRRSRAAAGAPATDAGTKDLLVELLHAYYERGWVAGTGGGICGPTQDGNIFLAPTGVHKELVEPRDFFVVSPEDGRVIRPAEDPALKPSECNPIFCATARARGSLSSMHSHALNAVLAADLARGGDHIVIERFEMLKGIHGLSNEDVHRVPVIDNTPRERELTAQVETALADPRFKGTFALLVRDHGAYIWGADLWETKRHVEVYHFLFDAVISRRSTAR